MSITQIRTIFEKQKSIRDIDNALDIITFNVKFKRTELEVQVFNHPDLLPLPNELNPQRIKKTLVIIDDCTIINSINPIQLFVNGRPLNINTIYLSQKYTKVPATIRENCNVFILFKQSVKTIKENIYPEIGDQFDSEKEMINLFNNYIKDKHDFIMLNKDNGKWLNKTLAGLSLRSPDQRSSSPPSNSIVINSGMAEKQTSYLEAKAKAFKAEQANRKSMNDLRHFSSALLERTSEVFKPITANQDKNQELLTKSLEHLKADIKDPLENKAEDIKGGPNDPTLGSLSKIECIDLIESDENMDELFGITMYKDDIIRFHIFLDLYKHKLIEKGIDHKIEFIEEKDQGSGMNAVIDRTLIKASRTQDKIVIKDISFPATKELMIALTKDVGIDFDKNALEQYRLILGVCLKPELDTHIFKIPIGRPSNNHIDFINSIEEKLKTSRKFDEFLKNRIKIGLGYKDIAFQPIVIPPNADEQYKRIFILLGSLKWVIQMKIY